ARAGDRAQRRPRVWARGRAGGRIRRRGRAGRARRPVRPAGPGPVAGRAGVRPLRSPIVQAVLAWLFAGWVRLCVATIRWTSENAAAAEEARKGGDGVVIAFWHGRLALAPAGRPAIGDLPVRGVISLSRDGEFIARAMARLGFPAIRGSSAKAGTAKAKG